MTQTISGVGFSVTDSRILGIQGPNIVPWRPTDQSKSATITELSPHSCAKFCVDQISRLVFQGTKTVRPCVYNTIIYCSCMPIMRRKYNDTVVISLSSVFKHSSLIQMNTWTYREVLELKLYSDTASSRGASPYPTFGFSLKQNLGYITAGWHNTATEITLFMACLMSAPVTPPRFWNRGEWGMGL